MSKTVGGGRAAFSMSSLLFVASFHIISRAAISHQDHLEAESIPIQPSVYIAHKFNFWSITAQQSLVKIVE